VNLPDDPIEPFWWPGDSHGHAGPGEVVGYDEGSTFVVLSDGSVLAAGIEGVPDRFVNSSVESFAQALRLVAVHRVEPDAFRSALSALDPAALGDDAAYWSLVLDQIEDELL
jgi:hypothetical protein